MDEHLNQMLVNALSKFVQEHREPWDGHLVEFVYSYNTVVKVSTHRSPFKVMDVPIQSDTYDCGLFTITFATALTQGKKPKCFFFRPMEHARLPPAML